MLVYSYDSYVGLAVQDYPDDALHKYLNVRFYVILQFVLLCCDCAKLAVCLEIPSVLGNLLELNVNGI